MDNKKVAKVAKIYECKKCDYYTSKKNDFNKHLLTRKHRMITYDNINVEKKFICECGKEYINRHNLSRHKKICNGLENSDHHLKMDKMAKNGKKMAKNGKISKNVHFSKNENSECKKLHFCECGKSYKHQCSLSKHKKTCEKYKQYTSLIIQEENKDLKEMVKELMIKCTELAEKPTTINNTTNNTQFNVMNYLNTECKDAMNLTDFIESFEFSLKDLQLLSTKGYQESMENTFIKQLCDMEKTKRPIHCSDKKRKSFYIKDNDVWEKDTNNVKLIRGMKNFSFIHNNTLNQWKNKNSDWNSNERKQIFYCNSILEFAKCDKEKERNKILSKLGNLSIK